MESKESKSTTIGKEKSKLKVKCKNTKSLPPKGHSKGSKDTNTVWAKLFGVTLPTKEKAHPTHPIHSAHPAEKVKRPSSPDISVPTSSFYIPTDSFIITKSRGNVSSTSSSVVKFKSKVKTKITIRSTIKVKVKARRTGRSRTLPAGNTGKNVKSYSPVDPKVTDSAVSTLPKASSGSSDSVTSKAFMSPQWKPHTIKTSLPAPKSAALPFKSTKKPTSAASTTSKTSILPGTPKSTLSNYRKVSRVTSTSSGHRKSIEWDSLLYRCPQSYDQPEGYPLADFTPYFEGPLFIEYDSTELDKIITIDSSNVPYSVGTFAQEKKTPLVGIIVVTVLQSADTPPTVATGTEESIARAGGSMVACAGASMCSLTGPPAREESLGGSNLEDAQACEQAAKVSEQAARAIPMESADESLAASAGASMASLVGPPPRQESLGGSAAEEEKTQPCCTTDPDCRCQQKWMI